MRSDRAVTTVSFTHPRVATLQAEAKAREAAEATEDMAKKAEFIGRKEGKVCMLCTFL